MSVLKTISTPLVRSIYATYPAKARAKLMRLRKLILETAKQTDGVGEIEETLRWGVPSYLTKNPKSGTTIRLDYNKSRKEYSICVHCQTNLISTFRAIHGDKFVYDKNRGLLFTEDQKMPEEEIKEFFARALTYHIKRN